MIVSEYNPYFQRNPKTANLSGPKGLGFSEQPEAELRDNNVSIPLQSILRFASQDIRPVTGQKSCPIDARHYNSAHSSEEIKATAIENREKKNVNIF